MCQAGLQMFCQLCQGSPWSGQWQPVPRLQLAASLIRHGGGGGEPASQSSGSLTVNHFYGHHFTISLSLHLPLR